MQWQKRHKTGSRSKMEQYLSGEHFERIAIEIYAATSLNREGKQILHG